MNKKLVLTACILLWSVITTQAYKMINIPDRAKKTAAVRVSIGDCVAGSSQTDLDINDVRARMLDDGDKWWDLNIAHYIVPQVAAGQTPVCSIFAGSIWVGGIDAGGQLKIAAATYRQNGNDWFPGPIPASGVVNQAICSAFDNHWQVFGAEISDFLNGQPPSEDILMWPGTGNTNNPVTSYAQGVTLAPFNDVDGNGIYDPQPGGDYPIIQPSATSCGCVKQVYADQMIWWCYNDIGNVHTESVGSIPIGMQVNEEAWAYKTNDQINDMTFYHYRIINDGGEELDSTFMGQWVDPDLGWYADDYVGCDPSRSLGVDYNGEAVDGPGVPNYGNQPPLVGTTYFQGPSYRYRTHPNSADTATRDTCLKMSSFIWYNNDFTAIGNPIGASEYYGYLSGTWIDGTPFTFGGNGHGGSVKSQFMFPSDPPDESAGAWSECEAGDVSGDRRYIQASGPFTLQPGAVNDIVVGAVWVRPPVSTYPCPSFKTTIDIASDKAQALFNSCFQLVDGPNAPDVTITELDKELVLNLINTDNAKVEQYAQADPNIKAIPGAKDTLYKFQGYQIYQLLNNQVTPQNYTDITQAKLIAQCDVKDGIGTIINYVYSTDLDANVPTLMVQGADQGIKHTFDITTDAFALGNSQLINFQPYYFSVISYAYNNYRDTTGKSSLLDTSTGKQVFIYTIDTQTIRYLAGRNNIAVYTGIPHKPAPEADGTITNSVYGEGAFITREEGMGNGGNFLDLTQASINAIITSPTGLLNHPTYQQGLGPIVVKVIDPKRVPADSFSVALIDTGMAKYNNTDSGIYITNGVNLDSSTTKWILTNITTGDTVHSDTTIATGNEQLFPQWGISIYINQVLGPGWNTRENNGLISSEVDYDNPKNQWLSGLVNEPPTSDFHWILSGTYDPPPGKGAVATNPDYPGIDDNMKYANVIGGTWAPYVLCSPHITYNPIWYTDPNTYLPGPAKINQPSKLENLNSIDVVFTPDQSQWSRCVVVEEDKYPNLAQGGAQKMSLRKHPSWDGGINADGTPVYDSATYGLSYFPGYAINLETGQRLNIFFSEDSWLVSENGNDMLWNPTANEFSPVGVTLLGGQQYIYVTNEQYDGCNKIYTNLLAYDKTLQVADKEAVYADMMWVGMTFLAPGSTLLPLSQGLIPTVTTVKIRIAKPYALFTAMSDSTPVYNFSLKNIAADTGNMAMAKNALDSIEVVPNPYYAYSNYEQSALDNEIKFTNLPQVCTISIYTLNGELVNTINYTGPYDAGKFNNLESTNWNLTNSNGTPIASGVYLIYFSSPGLGTRCIKWFGVRRPIDVSNF